METEINPQPLLIATHNGKFHLDEVLATAILLNIFPNAKILRTREQTLLDKADIVYDVGSIHNEKTLRFDHHQKTFTEAFSPDHHVRLSSAGLVYRHFAKQLLEKFEIKATQEIINRIYVDYFESVDATDNGVENPKKYKDRTLASIVSDFYMPITEEDVEEAKNFLPESIVEVEYQATNEDGVEETRISYSHRFKLALKFVMRDLHNFLSNKKILFDQLEEIESIFKDLDSQILLIPENQNASAKSIFLQNKKHKKNVLFIIYCNKENYRIYAMKKNLDTFETVCPLNLEWGGLCEEELRKKCGVKTANFVHVSGFTGGARDLEGAIEMCNLSIKKFNEESIRD